TTALSVLLDQHANVIATAGPATPYDRLGYQLEDVLMDDTLDLPRLLVGSEGTLAFFTETTLRTMPLPAGRAILLVNVSSLERAVQAVQRILPTGPSACELLDRRLLSLARGNEVASASALISPDAEAVLLIEYETEAPDGARRLAEGLAERLGQD